MRTTPWNKRMLAAWIFTSLLGSSWLQAAIVFDFAECPPANQGTANLVIGQDFSVGTTGWVTRIGAYDDGGDGFLYPISVAIYNRVSGAIVAGTSVVFLGTGDPLESQTRWRTIEPVELPPGDYSVVAANYGSGPNNERDFNAAYEPYLSQPSPLGFNSVDGALVLGGSRWQWGNDLPATFFTILYPDFMTDWGIQPVGQFPMPLCAAGTLDFTDEPVGLPPGPFTLKLSANPSQLWPPNGQRVPVSLAAVAETADGKQWAAVKPHIVSVTCNEVYGKAARDKRNPQWVITGDLSLTLVAKKIPGRMNARVYTITVQAEGREGFVASSQIRVVVPAAAPRTR